MRKTEIVFKQRSSGFSRGCATVFQVIFFLIGTVAVFYLVSMLISGDMKLSENWEVLFLIPMYILMFIGFFAKKAKRSRGKFKLSDKMIRTDDFIMANKNVELSVYNRQDNNQSVFHLYTLRDLENKFFLVSIFQDDFFKILMEKNWVPTKVYNQCSIERMSPNDADPVYSVICENGNHGLVYNLESGAYATGPLDSKEKLPEIEPQFFIEDPKFKKVRF